MRNTSVVTCNFGLVQSVVAKLNSMLPSATATSACYKNNVSVRTEIIS